MALHEPHFFFSSFTPPPQVTFKGVYEASSSPITVTFSNVSFGEASPTNEVIVMLMCGEVFSPNTMTIGGVTADLIASVLEGNGDNEGVYCFLFSANVPAGGTGTILVSGGSSFSKSEVISIGVWSGRYLRSRTPRDFVTNTTDILNLPVDVLEDGFVIAAGIFIASGSVSTSNVTENFDQTSGEGWAIVGGSAEGLSAQSNRAVAFNGPGAGAAGIAASWY